MKKSGYQVTMDQFVCGNILVKEYLGQILQYFKPRNLSLFQLAVIAQVVHMSYPNYAILNTQCYYYAALVYAVAEKIGGIKASKDMDKENIDLVSISGSYLSNHYGQWKGLKVTRVEPDSVVVHRVLERFKKEFNNELAQVFFHNDFSIYYFLLYFSDI